MTVPLLPGLTPPRSPPAATPAPAKPAAAPQSTPPLSNRAVSPFLPPDADANGGAAPAPTPASVPEGSVLLSEDYGAGSPGVWGSVGLSLSLIHI